MTPTVRPAFWLVIAAFGAIYVIWGSTYLAIRYAIETIPPFLMAGTRFLLAGFVLYAFTLRNSRSTPTLLQWRDAFIAGALMLLIGNGCVTWAERVIPSGTAALLVALTPMWMVFFDWIRPGGIRPRLAVIVGLAIGFAGVAVLVRGKPGGIDAAYGWGIAALMAASIGWAIGSLFNRNAQKPSSPLLAIAMQLIAGGVLLTLTALIAGEPGRFSFARITLLSAGAWLYLSLVGALIGFTAYVWLLQVSTPARVSTYAYVNPFIAVLLGSTIGREELTPGLLLAGTLIIAAVTLIVRSGAKKQAG